jgi:hypothetical protein
VWGSYTANVGAALTEAEAKDELKATTDEAVSRGAFGAPTIFVRRANEPKEKVRMHLKTHTHTHTHACALALILHPLCP